MPGTTPANAKGTVMYDERDIEEYKREAEAEAKREYLEYHPVKTKLRVARFTSRSKGRGRKRKYPEEIILIQYGASTQCHFWDGSDHNHNGKLPWDNWATEVYGPSFCENSDQHPDDILRKDVI